MLKPLKTLLAYIQKPGVPSQEIETALDDARQAAAAAEQDLTKAEQAYHAGLLDSTDAALQKLIEQKQAAIVQRDRARALVEALETKLTAVRADELQAEKLAVYGAAMAKRDAAARRLQDEYTKHASIIAAIIRDCAEADAAVAQANADLLADDDPLLTVETLVRSHRAQPRKILKDKVVSLWAYASTGHILNDETQAQVRSTGGDTGALYTDGYVQRPVEVVRRRYRRVEFLRETTGHSAESLATTVRLPGLTFAEPPIWDDTRSDRPEIVLARAAEIQTQRDAFSRSPDIRAPEVEVIPVDDAVTTPAEAA